MAWAETDRQDRQRFDSIGRTVLQTVAPKRFALCYRSYRTAVCLSVLFVCLSVCNAAVLWPNGWMDQDETWRAGRPRPWPRCIRWGPSSPFPKGIDPNFRPISIVVKGRSPPPSFRPMSTAAKRIYMDQDATWHGGRPRLRRYCVTWGFSSHSP